MKENMTLGDNLALSILLNCGAMRERPPHLELKPKRRLLSTESSNDNSAILSHQ